MKELIFNECLKRMEMLKLSSKCIAEFKKGNVWKSENLGALYELTDSEKKIVEEFEKEHENCIVYHIIHNLTDFGEIYSLLYVSPYQEEWQMEIEDIKENILFAYCKNISYDYCSEFGSIMYKSVFGGLVRTA